MRKRFLIALATTMSVVGVGSAAAAATAPKNTSPPTISGEAQNGKTLTADPGTWSGDQPMTFTYQWRRCNAKGASCANIIGATQKTYDATSVDVGNTLRVRVRAANTTGSSAAVSAPTAVVAPKKSITLDANSGTAVYGRTVLLTGALRNGQAGESVTITELRRPVVGGIRTQAVATVKTDADGTFSLRVRPAVQTRYTATSGDAKSNAVGVRVRPLVRLKHIGPNRFLVRALAARSLVGKWASLQRWSRFRHQWIGVKLVFFRSSVEGVSPTITSRAVFRSRLAVRIRVVVPRLAARPGYIAGFSNSVRG
jgi:hypothetical protein